MHSLSLPIITIRSRLTHCCVRLLPLFIIGAVLVQVSEVAPSPAHAQTGATLSLAWSSLENDPTTSIAWGDYDGDGYLDLAVGNYEKPNQIYHNDKGVLTLAWETTFEVGQTTPDRTYSVAWGDYDNDGDLDLMVGNGAPFAGALPANDKPDGQPNRLYRNDNGHFGNHAVWSSPEADATTSIAWGDYDNDGDLDLAVGNGAIVENSRTLLPLGQPNRLYRNQGLAADGITPIFEGITLSSLVDPTMSVAWGDYNGDGKLDLAVGNIALPLCIPVGGKLYCGETDRLFANHTQDGNSPTQFAEDWISQERDPTFSVAWADVDNNGSLDLAVGNVSVVVGGSRLDSRNELYRNTGGILSRDSSWQPIVGDATLSLAWGDYDHDGDLDLAVGNAGAAGAQEVGAPNRIYQNDNGQLSNQPVWSSTETDDTFSVAWSDYDNDGDLDLGAGNVGILLSSGFPGQPNRLYRNNSTALSPNATQSLEPNLFTSSIAPGDYDGDGDLDLAVGNDRQPNQLYRNTGGTLAIDPGWTPSAANTTSVAWGDADNDGDLDLAVGNAFSQNQLYLNDGGTLRLDLAWLPPSNFTTSVAWGDYDNDGDLDLAVGNTGSIEGIGEGRFSQIYRNCTIRQENDGCAAGDHRLANQPSWSAEEKDNTSSVAWGDVDNDGDLDLAVGNRRAPNRLYRNDRGVLRLDVAWHPLTDLTSSVAWGDYDQDGDLDLAVGNYGRPNQLYQNVGGSLSSTSSWASVEADATHSIAWGDVDNDGDLDLAVGNAGFFDQGALTGQADRIYRNDNGALTPSASWSSAEADFTNSIALGDFDRDGAVDLLAGNDSTPSRRYQNTHIVRDSPNTPPAVYIARPTSIPAAHDANFYATSQILAGPTLSFSYMLSHPHGLPVQRVIGEYSLDGGGKWNPAHPADITSTLDLATSAAGTVYTYTWDMLRDGVMGQIDDVVFRLRAIPDYHPHLNAPGEIPEQYRYGSSSATTSSFRVRGSQVRVVDQSGNGVAGALVYVLPAGQTRGAYPLAGEDGKAFRTDILGYLQGRSLLNIGEQGDQLIALSPVAVTNTDTYTYTLHHTSGSVTSDQGPQFNRVITPGIQTLTISPDNPLLLFNLDISLEWDAHDDAPFMNQLHSDLQRTSELLYDWTNGQAALGNLTIYHDKEHWDQVDVRIYATNRMRPNASQGGITSKDITETLTLDGGRVSTMVYEHGEVRIGATWNRFGDASGTLGEDWPRSLAHELGHFAFFLDDNYIGLDANQHLISVDGCPGAMSDPYRDDYSEFHPLAGWLPACKDTLSNQETGRSDWATIKTFYPALRPPTTVFSQTLAGPNILPLSVTSIHEVMPVTPDRTVEAPIVSLLNTNGTRYQPGPRARAFLFRHEGDRVTDLGQPSLDQVLARGARAGDELCVYDLESEHLGCTPIRPGATQLTMDRRADWQPDLQITPVTSQTLAITVTATRIGSPPPDFLAARFFPEEGTSSPTMSLQLVNGQYIGRIPLQELDIAGSVRVWVEHDSAPRRELVTDYALGGNPAARRRPRRRTRRRTPALSADGQVILFGNDRDFPKGTFYTIQTATTLPPAPPWTTVVGYGYRLFASPGAPSLMGTSINISYLEDDLLPGTEGGIGLYFWDSAFQKWTKMNDATSDIERNEVSAATRGPGLYALMTSVDLHSGWNLFAYPWTETLPVTSALKLINGDGSYTTVYGYDETDEDDPWKVYDVAVPDWVNDLHEMQYGRGYWINVTTPPTARASKSVGTHPGADATQTNLSLPPATYYGIAPRSAPNAALSVEAYVNDTFCGQTQTETRVIAGRAQPVFVIDVHAAGAGADVDCGRIGQPVTFSFLRGEQEIATVRATWDNNRVHLLQMTTIYLPLAAKDESGE